MIISLVAWASRPRIDLRWGIHTDAGVLDSKGNSGLCLMADGPKRVIMNQCRGDSRRERRSLMNHYIAGVVALNNGDLNSIRVIGG